MDNMKRNISIIGHIQRYCQEITVMVDRFGDSLENFKGDSAYRHACSMCIIQIGELTTNLTDEFKQKHNGVPWKSIKFLRNLVAHNYDRMSITQIWNTIKQDIPNLLDYCSDILKKHMLPHENTLACSHTEIDCHCE